MAQHKDSWWKRFVVNLGGVKTLRDKSRKEIEKNERKEKGLTVKPKPKDKK